MSFSKNLIRVAALLSAFAGLAGGAAAQRFEGDHHIVRFGVFGLGYSTPIAVAVDGADRGSGTLGHHGIGMVAGIDWVRRGYLFGIEGDWAATSANAVIGGDRFGLNSIATVRGRLGTFVHPNWLVYGTAGVAATAVELHTNGSFPAVTKVSHTQLGLTAGVGTEYALSRHIFLFGEYLAADPGRWHRNVQQTSLLGGTTSHTFDNRYGTEHMFRLGVKFKVGEDYGYHDDVAERIGRRR